MMHATSNFQVAMCSCTVGHYVMSLYIDITHDNEMFYHCAIELVNFIH